MRSAESLRGIDQHQLGVLQRLHPQYGFIADGGTVAGIELDSEARGLLG